MLVSCIVVASKKIACTRLRCRLKSVRDTEYMFVENDFRLLVGLCLPFCSRDQVGMT